jgi:hypothetical protein
MASAYFRPWGQCLLKITDMWHGSELAEQVFLGKRRFFAHSFEFGQAVETRRAKVILLDKPNLVAPNPFRVQQSFVILMLIIAAQMASFGLYTAPKSYPLWH